jgi:hypothetical protein
MANKPVFTQEQAVAFEQFTKIREGFALESFITNKDMYGGFTGQYAPLNDVSIEDFARAVYSGGYELEGMAEEEYWDAIGREIAEFRHGDVMLDKFGEYIHGSPEYAAMQYEQKNFSGLYPTESFRPFGKDVR